MEETYLVLGRYLRMLVFDPHYSKYALGVPGLIFVLVGTLIALGQASAAGLGTLLILGGAFLVRGFSLDRTVVGMLQRGPTGYNRLIYKVGAVLVVSSGIDAGYVSKLGDTAAVTQVTTNPSQFFVYGGTLIGYFISGSLDLVWIGFAIYGIGALLSHAARTSVRWRRDAYGLVMLGILYFPVLTFSNFLVKGTEVATFFLVSYILLGLAMIFILTISIYPRVRPKSPAETE